MKAHQVSALLVTALLALAAGPAFAEPIYRWVDDSGTVHFGTEAPPGVNAVLVEMKAAPAASADPYPRPATAEAPAADAKDQSAGDNEKPLSPAEKSRQERAARQAKAAEERKQVEAKCEAMRQQLAWTEPHPRVIVSTPDGGTRRLSDDERMKMVNEAKTYIAENCQD